jgi:hypothetical protein
VTLPSEDLPILERAGMTRRGVAPAIVAALVAGAFAAGVLLGWGLPH